MESGSRLVSTRAGLSNGSLCSSAGKKCGITMNANDSQNADLRRKRIIALLLLRCIGIIVQ